jgi:O-antigen/teichoic acid export membrane protein
VASTLIFPKLLGVVDYSFWQLYSFYVGYVGVLQFGWNDGIYLRYGGQLYGQLEKGRFAVQFWMLVASQVVISGLVVLGAVVLVPDSERTFVLAATGLAILILGTRAFFFFIWQATNLIGHYARALALELVVFIIAVTVWFVAGGTGYLGLIVCDLIAKSVSLAMSVYWCRGLVMRRQVPVRGDLAEAWQNMSVGIKLMLANLASMLVVGVVRFAIERHWDVVTFGKVSLSLSVSGLVMVFLNAVGVVVFPTLRRIQPDRKPELFLTLRTLYLPAAALLLVLYFPLRTGLALWLPAYAESLRYMGLLFPVFVFEGRMALLINSFLKDLREERSMLAVNLGGVALSVVLSGVFAFWLGNLELTVASILLLIVARATVAELVLSRRLGVLALSSLLPELGLTLLFVGAAWFLDVGPALSAYGAGYLLFLTLSWRRLRSAARLAVAMVR